MHRTKAKSIAIKQKIWETKLFYLLILAISLVLLVLTLVKLKLLSLQANSSTASYKKSK